jgi:hypothetical protein
MKHLQLNKAWLLGLVAMAAGLSGCEGFWGKKLDPSFIDVPIYTNRDVAYVPIQPVWDGFMHPVDIAVGYDELIYVADDLSEEIICFDQAGNELGRLSVPGVHSIAQDRSLDLLALGTFDTLGTTLQAIYRIHLDNAGGYGLSSASIQNKVLHPFYYKSTFAPGVDDAVALNNIGLRANNEYYIARSGSGTSPVFGPDDAIVMFNAEDDFVSTVRVNTQAGILGDYFKKPLGITTKAQPPQSPFVSGEGDFYFSSASASTQIKVQSINVIETENGTDFLVEELATGDTSKADGFLYEPGRFANPIDLTYSGDGTNYLWVVDAEKDSVFQFTNTGLEGVKAPAGSVSTKNILVSFGGTGVGISQFSQPTAVAYYRRILYVADAGNRRVLRFKLTTDFD